MSEQVGELFLFTGEQFFISILVRIFFFFYEMMISVLDEHDFYNVSTLYQQSTERKTCHSSPLGFSTL